MWRSHHTKRGNQHGILMGNTFTDRHRMPRGDVHTHLLPLAVRFLHLEQRLGRRGLEVAHAPQPHRAAARLGAVQLLLLRGGAPNLVRGAHVRREERRRQRGSDGGRERRGGREEEELRTGAAEACTYRDTTDARPDATLLGAPAGTARSVGGVVVGAGVGGGSVDTSSLNDSGAASGTSPLPWIEHPPAHTVSG
jgi:hypothetical protein